MLTINDTLNEFQKKRINYRINLDFNLELEKSNIKKERKKFSLNFRNQLDILIPSLYNDGIMFYGFEVFRSFVEETKDEMWYLTHLKVEDLINFFRENIELIEFCYIVIEFDKKGKTNRPTLKGIIGIRSLIGNNNQNSHLIELKKIFNDNIDDIKIKKFNSLKKIKSYWNLILRENNFKFHRFTQYSEFYSDLYGSISDLELQYDNIEHIAFALDEFLNAKNCNLSGIKDRKPDQQTVINYLITIYMQDNSLFLYKNKLFLKKNINDLKYIDSIYFLSKNNVKIFEALKKDYPQQLKGLKIPSLLNSYWEIFFENIKKHNHYLPTIEAFEYNIID